MMKLYHLVLLVVLCVSYVSGSSCKDKYTSCGSWKRSCSSSSSSDRRFMKKYCPKTCGSCSGSGNTGSDISTGTPSKCGVENRYVSYHRISGGSETSRNQYPWMVRLPMGCGGALITDKHVLTAKHCVDEGYWKGKKVKYGVHNQKDPNDYKEVEIKDYVWPSAYKYGYNDMAIITLKNPVDLSDAKVGTVCLPTSANKVYIGKSAMAMGWGMTSYKSGQSAVLKHVLLNVADHKEKNLLFTESPVVNGVPQDPCAGDSGGPLVYKEYSGRWTIIGTVNGQGYDCRTGKFNGVKGYGYWNKVTDFLDWIKENTKN